MGLGWRMATSFHKPTLFGGPSSRRSRGARIRRRSRSPTRRPTRCWPGARGSRPAVVDRLVAYTDEHGIDAVAELWSRASAHSLPGALWRIYLLRVLIRQDPEGVAFLFQRGTELCGRSTPSWPGRPRRPGRRRSPRSPTRSCAASSRATSPSRSSARRRSAASWRGAPASPTTLKPTRPGAGTELTTRASVSPRPRRVAVLRKVVENGQPRLKSGGDCSGKLSAGPR